MSCNVEKLAYTLNISVIKHANNQRQPTGIQATHKLDLAPSIKECTPSSKIHTAHIIPIQNRKRVCRKILAAYLLLSDDDSYLPSFCQQWSAMPVRQGCPRRRSDDVMHASPSTVGWPCTQRQWPLLHDMPEGHWCPPARHVYPSRSPALTQTSQCV